jgi:two-component system chemotaxis sensor kinase CheA
MKIDLSQFRNTFMQESAEHVASMETGLLDLRSKPDDLETLNAIFRSAHSIKGGAGSFGLNNLVRFTHALENLLDRLRSMEMAATPEIISLLLQSVDVVHALLDAEDESIVPPAMPDLAEKLHALSSGAEAGTDLKPELATQSPSQPDLQLKTFKVEFKPDAELFSSGTNPLVLLRNLAALGVVSVCELSVDDLPDLQDLDPEQCYLSWTVELATTHGEEEIREVFEFIEHLAEIRVHADAVPAAVAEAGSSQPQALAIMSSAPTPIEAAGNRTVSKKPASGEASSIRVPTDKVDRLIDLVGDLVIAQIMTAQMVGSFTPDCLPKLRDAVSSMERNTRELHERVMAIRMMPVGSLFQRYTRIVYDIAQSTGKQIRLETGGEETEIDKSMLELLGDPLTHIIRNSADHGIESVETRRAAGKPDEGLIGLRAFHRSGRIVIEITDDGAGIDTVRVRAKAVERGLIAADAELTQDQLRMLIFEPGFSTRDQVSDLSGRGVGMDVVKRNVQQLNGTVSLASELGAGSTVSIELPLTLAILEGLLVRVADRTLVLPLLSVFETVAPSHGKIVRVAEQGEVIVIRDESIPLLRMRRYIETQRYQLDSIENAGASVPSETIVQLDERSLVVVVEAGRKKIGLIVDELLGQQQVVVKSLEKNFHKVEGLMGATILGDGCVAPIIDVAAIAAMDLFSTKTSVRTSVRESSEKKLPALSSPSV